MKIYILMTSLSSVLYVAGDLEQMRILRHIRWQNPIWQIEQMKDLLRCSLVCIFSCLCQLDNELNSFLHTEQENGFSPVCINLCAFKERRSQNPFWHTEQVKGLHLYDKPFFCTVCSRGFRTNEDFETHKIVHTGSKPYKCLVCQKGFRINLHLQIMLYHTEYKRRAFHPCVFADVFANVNLFWTLFGRPNIYMVWNQYVLSYVSQNPHLF
jgi:hypothetical protein